MIEVAPESKNRMTYNEAIIYCQFLEHNGHTDWRMPTRHEYRSNMMISGWYQDRASQIHTSILWVVVPVRDV
jgi:hypothetical protein